MGDWTDRLRQETTTRTLAEVEAPDAGLICTENEVLFLNANGLQRAPLSEITKVSRDGPDLVLAGGAQTFVRGAISADKLSLANFFAEVKQAVAQARSKREVLMDTTTPATLTSAPPTMSISSSPASHQVETNLGRTQTPPPYPGMTQPPLEPQSVFSAPPVAETVTPRMNEAPRLGTVSATETSGTAFQPAGFWWRVLAYIIDGLVVGAVSTILLLILGGGSLLSVIAAFSSGDRNSPAAVSSILGLIGAYLFWALLSGIGSWLYYALLESSERQATLGKMATGLFVSTVDGKRISFGQASGRYWSKIGVSIALALVIGLVSVPFGDGAIASLLQLVYYAAILYTYIMCALTPRKQTLYDQISGSLVWKR
jgi:uncharacterized RDD family membrane protein YckC